MNKTTIIILVMVCWFVTNFILVSTHEDIHERINVNHHLEIIDKKVSFFGDSYVESRTTPKTTEQDYQNARYLNSWNELIGYYLIWFNMMIWTILGGVALWKQEENLSNSKK